MQSGHISACFSLVPHGHVCGCSLEGGGKGREGEEGVGVGGWGREGVGEREGAGWWCKGKEGHLICLGKITPNEETPGSTQCCTGRKVWRQRSASMLVLEMDVQQRKTIVDNVLHKLIIQGGNSKAYIQLLLGKLFLVSYIICTLTLLLCCFMFVNMSLLVSPLQETLGCAHLHFATKVN